jgi:hypothetical protein
MCCSGRAQSYFAILGTTIKQDRKPKEQNMSKIIYNHKFTAAAAFGAAALFSMLAFGSTAEAKSVLSCQGGTSKKVVDCCEKLVKENGRPHWMIQNGTSCQKAAACRGGPNDVLVIALVVKRCYIKYPIPIHDEHEPETKGRQQT